jgi:hypothetical protein
LAPRAKGRERVTVLALREVLSNDQLALFEVTTTY